MRDAILARHGESALSVKRVINGDPTIACPLTELGREQARTLGELIAEDPVEVCVTSQFQRAKETADIALAGRHVRRVVMPELDDILVGRFEGGTLEAFRAWISEHGPAAIPPGGGESRALTALRYARAFRGLVARPEDTALVVCHGLPVAFAVTCARGEDPPAFLPQEDYAEPHRLSGDELRCAADVLERWARDRLAA